MAIEWKLFNTLKNLEQFFDVGQVVGEILCHFCVIERTVGVDEAVAEIANHSYSGVGRIPAVTIATYF